MANKKEYDNQSIVKLEGPDKIRKRPAVIFGSDDIEGCQHSVFEIISNSIDEAREGHGNKIIITRYLDKSIEVQDFGRGMPVDWNEKYSQYNWELLFCEMYAGSKYDTNDGGSYEFSLGLNGLGLCSTQCASEYMTAEIKNGGYIYNLRFERGFPVGEMQKEPYPKRDTGTKIRWKPDLDVFTDIDIPLDYFKGVLERQAIVNNGVKFTLKNQISESRFETFEFYYENGIKDYVEKYVGEEAFTSVQLWQTERVGRDREDKPDYKVKINVSMCFSKTKQLKDFYHNSSYLEYGGAPDKALKSAFVSQIDSYIKQIGKYTKSDQKINIQDIEDCLVIIISSFSTQTSYENQTKKSITNKFIQEAITDFLKHQLEVFFIENKLEADRVAEQVLINMRSRVHAEKAKLAIKNNLTSKMDMGSRVEKFVDCRSKDVNERELFIVEGDSALGACKQARDSLFQAIMPVRGKILNCLKADFDKVFKSEIITDLIKVLGCGVEVKTKSNKSISTFDLNLLRWNKIIICTDADVDGFQIRTLILTMLYSLTPTLINEGKVYIAESPLYEITSKGETWFAYNEQEKAKALDEIGEAKYTIQRSKGLGENEPDMMWMTTMNPKSRRLIQVKPNEDATLTADTFDLLLGDNLQGRKDHIAQKGHLYMDLADIS